MTGDQVQQAFISYAKGKGLDLLSPSLSTFPRIFIDYYSEIEFPELDRSTDGDLLLFQYGEYDWGDGRYFESTSLGSFTEFSLRPKIMRFFSSGSRSILNLRVFKEYLRSLYGQMMLIISEPTRR